MKKIPNVELRIDVLDYLDLGDVPETEDAEPNKGRGCLQVAISPRSDVLQHPQQRHMHSVAPSFPSFARLLLLGVEGLLSDATRLNLPRNNKNK